MTLDTNGKLSVKKETGFWGSILQGLEAIAPLALAAIPGRRGARRLRLSGRDRRRRYRQWKCRKGVADIAGGMAGVDGLVGGPAGSALQDAATVTQYDDQVYGCRDARPV